MGGVQAHAASIQEEGRCVTPHTLHKMRRNLYRSMIECAKRRHWESFLESINDKTVWTAHWYMSGESTDGGKVQVPTLKARHANGSPWDVESNVDKSKVF